eukprot:5125340-Amphidinium_carterae.1
MARSGRTAMPRYGRQTSQHSVRLEHFPGLGKGTLSPPLDTHKLSMAILHMSGNKSSSKTFLEQEQAKFSGNHLHPDFKRLACRLCVQK